ncbi:hypothetical protein KCU98_g171, partial [Aureobasidium melanogenum]
MWFVSELFVLWEDRMCVRLSSLKPPRRLICLCKLSYCLLDTNDIIASDLEAMSQQCVHDIFLHSLALFVHQTPSIPRHITHHNLIPQLRRCFIQCLMQLLQRPSAITRRKIKGIDSQSQRLGVGRQFSVKVVVAQSVHRESKFVWCSGGYAIVMTVDCGFCKVCQGDGHVGAQEKGGWGDGAMGDFLVVQEAEGGGCLQEPGEWESERWVFGRYRGVCEGWVGCFGGEESVDGAEGGMFEDDWRPLEETAMSCVSMSAATRERGIYRRSLGCVSEPRKAHAAEACFSTEGVSSWRLLDNTRTVLRLRRLSSLRCSCPHHHHRLLLAVACPWVTHTRPTSGVGPNIQAGIRRRNTLLLFVYVGSFAR